MASRPVYLPTPFEEGHIKRVDFEFRWHSGMSISQKLRNVEALHRSAAEAGFQPLLEVSSVSQIELGRRLSAFSLKVRTPLGEIPLEAAYQGSKIFENEVSFKDIYAFDARSAKKDERLRNAGRIIAFDFFGSRWRAEPKTAFFDWLYLSALSNHERFLQSALRQYVGYTDISFNPDRSINNQARACALLVSLSKQGRLRDAMSSRENFLRVVHGVHEKGIERNTKHEQLHLLR